MAERRLTESRNLVRGFPVANGRAAVSFIGRLLSTRRGMLAAAVLFNLCAVGAGLVVPALLGDIIDGVATGGAAASGLDTMLLVIVGLVVAQGVLTFAARRSSAVLGYDLLAAAREEIVRLVLSLPLGRVESGSSGDLLTRITSDVSKMAAADQVGLSEPGHLGGHGGGIPGGDVLLNSPSLALPMLVTAAAMWIGGRYYLKRSVAGYINESHTYSEINATTTETVEGARTVEALGLGRRRISQLDDDTAVSGRPSGTR